MFDLIFKLLLGLKAHTGDDLTLSFRIDETIEDNPVVAIKFQWFIKHERKSIEYRLPKNELDAIKSDDDFLADYLLPAFAEKIKELT